jgi:hypothetical protein
MKFFRTVSISVLHYNILLYLSINVLATAMHLYMEGQKNFATKPTHNACRMHDIQQLHFRPLPPTSHRHRCLNTTTALDKPRQTRTIKSQAPTETRLLRQCICIYEVQKNFFTFHFSSVATQHSTTHHPPQ